MRRAGEEAGQDHVCALRADLLAMTIDERVLQAIQVMSSVPDTPTYPGQKSTQKAKKYSQASRDGFTWKIKRDAAEHCVKTLTMTEADSPPCELRLSLSRLPVGCAGDSES